MREHWTQSEPLGSRVQYLAHSSKVQWTSLAKHAEQAAVKPMVLWMQLSEQATEANTMINIIIINKVYRI